MKKILVTNGTNDFSGDTKASTERGYIKAAKELWPYSGMSRVKVRVWDQAEIVFETKIDIY